MSTTDKMSEHRVATIEPWHITEERFLQERNEIAESLFSLANEYMGTRGNFEEGFGGETLCGCYIGGIYVKEKQAYPWKRKAFPDFTNSMVNTANWLEILVEVDGESLEFDSTGITGKAGGRRCESRLGWYHRMKCRRRVGGPMPKIA